MRNFVLTILFISSSAFASEGTVNLRLDPIGVLIGSFGALADFKISSAWTLGPEFDFRSYTRADDSVYFTSKYQIDAWSAGLRANWFNNGAYTTGLYVGPALNYGYSHVRTKDLVGNTIKGSSGAAFFEATIGYGWFWDHFNIMLGAGGVIDITDSMIHVHAISGNHVIDPDITGLALEFSLGWVF